MRKGFSIVELLTALFIVCILVIAMTTIYTSSMNAISAIDKKLEEGFGATDILHLIVDDISKVSSFDTETSLVLESKTFDGVVLYRLEVTCKIYDNAGKELVYKKVIWQSDYDFETGAISLYRAMGGMGAKDPILDTLENVSSDSDVFVPVGSGLTYFTIQVPQISNTSEGEVEDYLDSWEKDEMPGSVIITLSFAEPVEYITGEVEVPVEKRITRRISVNRSKGYEFKFVTKDLDAMYQEDEEDLEEDMLEGEEDVVSEDGEVDVNQSEGNDERGGDE